MTQLRTDRRDDVLLIGIDRPDRHNALDLAMVEEFHTVLDAVRRDPCVLIVYSTTPGMFVAGADIGQLRHRGSHDALSGINAELFERLSAHRWPTIAAIDGPALGGGCELALACDFRLATAAARFAQPELQLGIVAGAGANWRLAQIVGLPVARRMLLAGEALSAQEAQSAGLIDQICTSDDLTAAAKALAARIRRASWQALELTKLALKVGRPPTTAHFDLAAQALLFESKEKYARMDAFLNRRALRATQSQPGNDG
jgi:enoyl-CoA hydratase